MNRLVRPRALRSAALALGLTAATGCTVLRPAPPVETRIEGVADGVLKAELAMLAEVAVPPSSRPMAVPFLQRMAAADARDMETVLRSRGWFQAVVEPRVAPSNTPPLVVFTVSAGERFRMGPVVIDTSDETARRLLQREARRILDLAPAAPYDGRSALDAARLLKRRLREQGYPGAEVAVQEALADHATRTVRLTFRAEPGVRARYGAVSVRGLGRLREDFIRNEITWTNGARFDVRQLEKTQRDLLDYGLFSMVHVAEEGGVSDDGTVGLLVDVRERKRNTFALGAGYTSDQGAEAETSWTRRNLFGAGEQMRLKLHVSEVGNAGGLLFNVPQFRHPDQDLVLDARYSTEDLDAYESRKARGSMEVKRSLAEHWEVRGGLALQDSTVDQQGERDSYTFASLPAAIACDTATDDLNPLKGCRVGLDSEPFFNLQTFEDGFWKNVVSASAYLPLRKPPLPATLALRAATGVITGAGRETVPADEKFYAGGGGSIRGYAYQSVGPLDGDEPLGGQSIVETSTELRFQFAKSFGAVVFLDGGTAYEGRIPDSSEPFLWGAGVGFRYFTSVGPIRADIAFPLDPRDGIDDAFQTYISIGQAF